VRHLGGVETDTRCEHAAGFPLEPDGEERVRIIAEKTKAADEAQKTYLEIVKKRNEIRDPLEKQGIDWKKSPTPELVAAEADVQRLFRTILLSRVWRLDAAPDPAALAVDPENRLLWREIGRKNFYLKDATADVPCRSVYLPVARSAVFDVMSLFDLPDPNLVSGARQESVVPSQMLFLLNSPVALAAARAAAGRILTETPRGDVPARLTAAFERVYGRPPEAEETEAGLAFLKSAASSEEVEAWAMLMQALMSAGEFRTID
jgi:hypothetical protein